MRTSQPEAIASSKCQVRSLSLDSRWPRASARNAAHGLQAGQLRGEEAELASSSSPKRSSIAIAATALRPMVGQRIVAVLADRQQPVVAQALQHGLGLTGSR